MINLNNGHIVIEDTEILPGISLGNFLDTTIGKNSTKVRNDRIYTILRFMPYTYKSKNISFTLAFKMKKLVSLKITILDGKAKTWPDISQENELKQKKKHDDLIFEITGQHPTVHYDWGDIYSIYDGKSIASFIDVIYKHT